MNLQSALARFASEPTQCTLPDNPPTEVAPANERYVASAVGNDACRAAIGAHLASSERALRSWSDLLQPLSSHKRPSAAQAFRRLQDWDEPFGSPGVEEGRCANFSKVALPPTGTALLHPVMDSTGHGQPPSAVSAVWRCTAGEVAAHRCRRAIQMAHAATGRTMPSTAAMLATFEVGSGAARRSAMLRPMKACAERPAYGIVVPASLVNDVAGLQIGESTDGVRAIVRILLECEADSIQTGEVVHGGAWGREVARFALELSFGKAHNRASRPPSDELAAGDSTRDPSTLRASTDPFASAELTRWYAFRQEHLRTIQLAGASSSLARRADTAILPSVNWLTHKAWKTTMWQRRQSCGNGFRVLAAAMKRGHEHFVSERQTWQQRLAPEVRACARQAAASTTTTRAGLQGPSIRLVFVGDSHMRQLFLHVASLLGVHNLTSHCGGWHGDMSHTVLLHGSTSGGADPGISTAVLHYVWIDGIYENGVHGCRNRGQYSGRTTGFPVLPKADFYFIGAPAHWEAAYCEDPWQACVDSLPAYLAWIGTHAWPHGQLTWVAANPRGGQMACPSCGCQRGCSGRSNARLLRLNVLGWLMASHGPYRYALFDPWAVMTDAFEQEAAAYDGAHFTFVDCEAQDSGDVPVILGVLDAIRAASAFRQVICPFQGSS